MYRKINTWYYAITILKIKVIKHFKYVEIIISLVDKFSEKQNKNHILYPNSQDTSIFLI